MSFASTRRRLKKLSVRLLDQADPTDRTIRFRIDAILQAEPAPEPIQFDSTLRLPYRIVRGQGRGQWVTSCWRITTAS